MKYVKTVANTQKEGCMEDRVWGHALRSGHGQEPRSPSYVSLHNAPQGVSGQRHDEKAS